MFNVSILSSRRTLFEGTAESVFLPGDQGEFEVLEFHKPLVSLLRPGAIVIDWARSVAIARGIARMEGNALVALVEEPGTFGKAENAP